MGEFNLIYEKWIPCVRTDGQYEYCGLMETLVRAHEFEDIHDTSPLVVVSLFRLLIAILHRNFGPSSQEEWISMWNNGRWDEETIDAYFYKWHHRFYLFDEKAPFFQTIVPKEEKVHPPQLLSLESAAGNNPTLFDHNSDESGESMQPARAARYLIARQSFSIGFGKSKPFYLSDSSLIRGLSVLLIGENLFESLALNVIGYTDKRPIPSKKGEKDLPCWEQADKPNPEYNGTIPLGYLDYLTWLSRRIHLIPNPQFDAVRGCRILQNLKVAEPTPLDPFKCYSNVEKKGLIPTGFREDKALWRDCHVLLQKADKSFKRPEVFSWVARVASAKPQELACRYWFRIVGLATDSGKAASVIFWRHEILPLPLDYLTNEELVTALKDALELVERIGATITTRAKVRVKQKRGASREDWVWGLGFVLTMPDEPDVISEEQKERIKELEKHVAPERAYWSRLETPFKRLLVDLPEDRTTDHYGSTVYGRERLPEWAETIRRAAKEAFRVSSAAVGESARSLKARAKAETKFSKRLNSILKFYSESLEEGGDDV